MSDIQFYTNPQSRGGIVHWMLEELGEPYETNWMDYGEKMKSPEYLAINPMGKVPTVVHKGTVVTECAAIISYLAASYPEKSLMPAPGSEQLANFYRWLHFASGPLELLMTVKGFEWQVPPEREMSIGYGKAEDVIAALEIALSKSEYICGDEFMAADVQVGSTLHWAMMFGALEKRPRFEEYVANLMQRPAAIRSQQLNEERSKQQEAAK